MDKKPAGRQGDRLSGHEKRPDALSPCRPVSHPSSLALRSKALSALRAWFEAEGFIEVETPVRIPVPALETHIDAPASGNAFLRTSPELHMKRLLAAGMEKIYQIGPCFREGERGARHNPEFTMLEWYRVHATEQELLRDTQSLLRHVAQTTLGTTLLERNGKTIDVASPWTCHDVASLYRCHAGWDPLEEWDADRFDLDMANVIEPALADETAPAVIQNFPAPTAVLAKLNPCGKTSARWELYIAGLELANACAELADPAQQRARFGEVRRERARLGRVPYPLDEPFLECLENMPPCAGIALGVDRLVMLLANTRSIGDVRAFC